MKDEFLTTESQLIQPNYQHSKFNQIKPKISNITSPSALNISSFEEKTEIVASIVNYILLTGLIPPVPQQLDIPPVPQQQLKCAPVEQQLNSTQVPQQLDCPPVPQHKLKCATVKQKLDTKTLAPQLFTNTSAKNTQNSVKRISSSQSRIESVESNKQNREIVKAEERERQASKKAERLLAKNGNKL